MQELSDERVLFAFSRDAEPALTVKSGETVRIRTQDCFGNQVQSPDDVLDEIDWDRINPATGPVFVEGAVPGGALKVTIENIELDPQTASCTGKDEGVCGDRFDAWSTHLCAIDGDKLVWNDQLSIPLNPMIGVIGTAPAEGAPADGFVGNYGGNMDNKLITKGTRLYFPVRVPGALLQMGDVHATMGDAELCGTGIEIAAQITGNLENVMRQAMTQVGSQLQSAMGNALSIDAERKTEAEQRKLVDQVRDALWHSADDQELRERLRLILSERGDSGADK